jgi:membrane-bound serine protease (ClpP class)
MDPTLGFVLIGAGFVFLLAEMFMPSFGILMVLALLSIVVGLILTFQAGTTVGLLTLLGVFVALPVFLGLLFHYWPKTPMGRRLILSVPADDFTAADLSVHKDQEQLRGRAGRALSALRPAGVVDFDGRRVDCITEGMMVEPGEWVRCIDVQAGRVVVRPAPKPDTTKLDSTEFG